MKHRVHIALFLGSVFTALGAGFFAVHFVSAQDSGSTKEAVDDLNESVKDKRDRIQEIDNLIGNYRDRIEEQEAKQSTLANEILLLENKIKEKELSVLRAQEEIEVLELEIDALQKAIERHEEQIAVQKELVGKLIRRINQTDEVTTLDILLTRGSLSEFFDHVERIKSVEESLGSSVSDLKEEKLALDAARTQQETKYELLIEQEEKLKMERNLLVGEQNFKTSLIAETEQSQEEFERIIYELRQQQQQTSDDIARLEDQLREKLDAVDDALARGDILLSWPVDPSRGITTLFHDSSYPFRHLFEHSGLDLRASVGTPIKAPAGGYIAWHRRGRLYGNYMMVIHPGGIATVYAHLSKFVAPADSYVERGDVIALTGGMPGHPGAGLSTGPHLHFEVRQNGIPVDPENFLPSVR